MEADMDGMSVGGVTGIGIGFGSGSISVARTAAPAAQGASAETGTPAAYDFVITISDSAWQALSRDPVAVISASTIARLADDLAALALLAVLEERDRPRNALIAAAAAIAAYLAIQSLDGT